MSGAKTYLEFGYELDGKRVPYDKREGQEAYDFFMVSRYLKDIIMYDEGKVDQIHHEEDYEDNVKKYTALSVCKDADKELVFYEIGSSLMGVISAFEHINKQFKELDVKNIKYVGVDNSKMMNAVATYLYDKDYKLELSEEKVTIPCDLFFAKGVSILYAFEEEELFCSIIEKARLAIFDYTFALGDEPVVDVIGSGKKGTYLSLKKCQALLNTDDKELMLLPSERDFKIPEGRKLYECVYGEKELIKKYLAAFEEKKKAI